VTKLPDGKFGPSDIGLNDKQLHEARTIRDAEARDPGVVRRTVDAAIAAGKEPTKARGRPRRGENLCNGTVIGRHSLISIGRLRRRHSVRPRKTPLQE